MRKNKYLKIIISLIVILLLASCTIEKASDDNNDVAVPESSVDLFSDVDIVFSNDFEDGQIVEIDVNIEDYDELNAHEFLKNALEKHGIKISQRHLVKISESFSQNIDRESRIKFIRYLKFDIAYVEYAGQRGYPVGIFFIFENQVYKGCIEDKGSVNNSDIIKTLDDQVWLVTYSYHGGTGLSGELVHWTDLTSVDLNVIDVYYDHQLLAHHYVFQYYEEVFVEFKKSDYGIPIAVTKFTEKIADPEEIIVFERSGEKEIYITSYTNKPCREMPDFIMSMLEENFTAIEEYAKSGNKEEQEVAKEMLSFYNEQKAYNKKQD